MEKQYQNHSAQMVIKRPGSGGGSLRVFDFTDKKEARGQMVLLVAVEASDKDNEKIIKTIADELAKQFFNAPTNNIEFAFENALARVNITIKDSLLTKPKNWLNKIHIVCLVARGQEVHLTAVGDMHAYLVHHDQIVDVIAPAAPTRSALGREAGTMLARTPNPVKLFSNIISGRLLPQAALILLNEPVLDYLSTERLRKVSQELAPAAAVNKLNELLSAAPANKQFGIAIIKRLPAAIQAIPSPTTPTRPPAPIAPDEEPAAPESLATSQRDYLRTAGAYLGAAAGQYGQKVLTVLLLAASKILEKIQRQLAVLLPRLILLPKILKTLLTDQRARAYYRDKLKSYASAKRQRTFDYFQGLPRRQKRVLIATAILTVILAGSIVVRLGSRARTERAANYKNLIAALSQKSDQAEATIIYKDETRARQILQGALADLKNLPQTNDKERGQYRYLANRLAALLDKLEKRTNLGELVALAVMAPAPAKAANAGLIFSGQNLLYYDGQSGALYRVDKENGLALPLPLNNELKPFNQALALDNKTLALLGQDTAILINSDTAAAQTRALDMTGRANEPFATYAKNVYTFSRSRGKIIRYRETGGQLQAPAPWLKETYDLGRMLDIAVDGSLYLLAEGGDIHLFLNNVPSLVWRSALTEPVAAGARLYTNANLKNLYILDPKNERLIQLTKKGELQKQYLSPQLKDSASFAVSPDEKQIYVLANEKIFRIDIISG